VDGGKGLFPNDLCLSFTCDYLNEQLTRACRVT